MLNPEQMGPHRVPILQASPTRRRDKLENLKERLPFNIHQDNAEQT